MKKEEKELALKLRIEGKSYQEILTKVKVSKSTLSLWLRDILLSEEQLKRINNKEKDYEKRSKTFKEKWCQKYKKINEDYRPPLKDAFFMLGLGIYMGEGSKYARSITGISNSNPKTLLITIEWFKKYFLEKNMWLGVGIQNHAKKNNKIDIKWWSKNLNIPINNFMKPVSIISKSSLKKRNTLKHGTCSIHIRGKGNWVIAEKIRKAIQLASMFDSGTV